MSTWLVIFLSILAWNLVTILVCILSKEDEKMTLTVATAFIYFPFMCIMKIYRKVRLIYLRKKYSVCVFLNRPSGYPDGIYLISDDLISQFIEKDDEEHLLSFYYIKVLEKRKIPEHIERKQIITQKRINSGEFNNYTKIRH